MAHVRIITAFVRKEAMSLRADPTFVFFLFVFPLLLAILLSRPLGLMPGVGHGADQTIPGFTVMFGFYVMTYLGMSHYREHGWGGWVIVRASGLPRWLVLCGVVTPYFLLGTAQMTLMFLIGRVAFDIHMNGSIGALLLMIVATQFVIVTMGVLLLNITSHYAAMQNLNQLVVLGFGAIGGALVPLELMPGWSQAVGHLTPQFWALEGLRAVLVQHAGITDVAPNLGVLAGMGCLLAVTGVAAFDPAKQRRLILR